jgi:hypothetical protein
MEPDELIEHYPLLYHMAADGGWESIARHGLLSTSALLDLFEITGQRRTELESRHRPESVPIDHPRYGRAWVRDQKPMDDAGLLRALQDGLTPEHWYRMLNQRVFFWLRPERLFRLLNARAYRLQAHTVLTVDTAAVVREHAREITLSPINSGATKPFAHPRGRSTFLPLREYPFRERRASRSLQNAVVELAVTPAVPGIADMVVRVARMRCDQVLEVVWKP